MDFWDQTQWKFIPQNDPNTSEPTFTAPDLLKHVLPQVKLILLLRDPIERYFKLLYLNLKLYHTTKTVYVKRCILP